MFTHSKTSPNKSSHHAWQSFFSKDSANQPSGSFFTHISSPPTIQKKCAACEAEERIQTKLTIGQPNDQYEREADAVADRVVGQSETNIQRQEMPEEKEEVQRQPEDEEEEIQAKPLTREASLIIQRQAEEENEEEETIQPKSKSTSQVVASSNIAASIKSTQGCGQALTGSSRDFFESSFGRYFGDVNIHNDSRANHLAGSINARAFTHKSDIYFYTGEYQPHSSEGKRLLAHELTHVIQQRRTENNIINRQQNAQPVAPRVRQPTVNEVREFIEETIRFWDATREYLGYRTVDRALIVTMLSSWLRMVNNSWRLIDTRLNGDAILLNRVQTTYRNTVSALINKASSDLRKTQQQLYQQHNTRIAWWARRTLALRDDIVFILGGGDSFYTSATQYFNFIRARIISNLRSLREVRDWLNTNRPSNRLPWGDVSIVVHANLEGQMQAPVEPGGERVTPDSLREAIQDRTFRALPNEVMDNASRIMIRGCALGRNQQILQLLRSAFGGNEESPHIYAPVHLQSYGYQWRRRGRHGPRVTTSAEEYFQEFWYVGFPLRPAPNRRALIRMFNQKYPNDNVGWSTLFRTRGAVRRQNYSVPFTFEQTNEAPASGSSRHARRRIANFIRRRMGNPRGMRDIRETSRDVDADGTVTINFSYRRGGQLFEGATIPGLLPRIRNQRGYRALLSQQNDLMNATRPLEEGSNLTANDFFWRLRRVRNRGANTFDYQFTGQRTVLRMQRDLVEPDPNNPGRTRRVTPETSELTHYGREVPSNY